jgi:SOS response regulatory protein OraA/RecX
MANAQLEKFIEDRKSKGDSDADISKLLLEKGWSKKDVDAAFSKN